LPGQQNLSSSIAPGAARNTFEKAGTAVDIPPGSLLEQTYGGASNLLTITRASVTKPVSIRAP
jgi:hypothetical protein